MSVAVKTNFALSPETIQRMNDLCRLTYRSKSDLIDWLVAEAYAKNNTVSISTLPCPPDCEPVPLATMTPGK